MNYESQLFEIAPSIREVMLSSKRLNNGSFLRGRTGWIRRGIKNPESIYEHSCKVALAAFYLFGNNEALELGAIHDFPEIFEVDHIPWEIDNLEKMSREYAVMRKLKEILPNGNHWYNVWDKYETRTGIGELVYELDKICPVIQAIEYLPDYPNNDLEEFYSYTKKKIRNPKLLTLLDEMWLKREEHTKNVYQGYFDK